MAINRENYEFIVNNASRRIPVWARSSNPIVRRHLGFNWRTVPPQLQPLLLGLAIWSGIFAIGLIFPPLQEVAATIIIASVIIFPFVGILYARILLLVSLESTRSMQEETHNNTFPLLRATPMTLEQIFLGKIAAAIWYHMDNLMLVAQISIILSPPLLLVTYMAFWNDHPVVLRVMIMLAMVVSLLRLILEPIMVGVIAVFMALVLPSRNLAVSAAVVTSTFYFIMLNALAGLPNVWGFTRIDGVQVPPDATLITLFTIILPIVIPVVVSLVLLRLCVAIVSSD